MRDSGKAPGKIPARQRTGTGLALLAALVFHTGLLLLPVGGQAPGQRNTPAQIELRLLAERPRALEAVPAISAAVPADGQTDTEAAVAAIPPLLTTPAGTPISPTAGAADELEQANSAAERREEQGRRVANIILGQPFLSEESVAEKLFGPPREPSSPALQKDFRFPLRANLSAMLDRPLPDLPFAYTPGLVRFAYEPGLHGELQRFWDIITPEFGWTTRNGTEVRCIWVLIVGGCAWQ